MTITATNYAIKKGLPKKTQSICPECGKIIEANIFARDGKVYMEKTCPEHGDFSDVYWSHATTAHFSRSIPSFGRRMSALLIPNLAYLFSLIPSL